MALLKEQSPVSLSELKEKSGLSNKKWDVSIKGLTGKKLTAVTKTENDLVEELVQKVWRPKSEVEEIKY